MASGGKAPTPPNPQYVAGLQTDQTKDLIDYSNTQNRVNYTTPTGTATWDKTPIFNEEAYNKALAEWEQKYPAGGTYDPNALYLAENPDVASAIAGGGFSGDPRNHYREYGQQEGRTNFWDIGPDGRPAAPKKEDFTTYEWNATSSLNPQEQGIYQAGADFRTGIANTLTNNAAGIFANAGPTDYSGVAPLQYADKVTNQKAWDPYLIGANDAANYKVRESGILTGDMLADYSKLDPNDPRFSFDKFGGGPGIRDYGANIDQLDLSAFDQNIKNWGAEGGATGANFANLANQQSNRWNNERSSMRDWASILGPQLQSYQNQMGAMDPWAYDQQGADAMYRSQMRYAQPQWEDDRKKIEARLGEQGFVPGTPAYNNALKQMLDSQAMERDQARDKATLAGREYGNQAFDNRSGNLQNMIANLLGFGEMGIATDTGRDEGNAAFGKLGQEWADTGIAAGALQNEAGKLGLDSQRLGLDYLLGKTDAFGANTDARRLGLDSDIARANQAREDYSTMTRGVQDLFGIQNDITETNNAADAQRIDDILRGAQVNINSDIATNAANRDYAQTYADIVKQNNDAQQNLFDSLSADAVNVGNANANIVNTNNDARAQGLTEADMIQQGDLNWLLDLFGQLGVQLPPEMMQAGGGNGAGGADIAQLFQDLFGGQMAGYNADVSSGNANTAAVGSIVASIATALATAY